MATEYTHLFYPLPLKLTKEIFFKNLKQDRENWKEQNFASCEKSLVLMKDRDQNKQKKRSKNMEETTTIKRLEA